MQNKDDGVGGLPAITLQVWIKNRNRNLVNAALLEKLPSRKYRTIGIGELPANKLFKWNMCVMLSGKVADFSCFGFRNFLCKSIGQLFKKTDLCWLRSAHS
jgi:hypothetical protein